MKARRWVVWSVVAGGVCVLLAGLGVLPAPFVLAGYLVVGWIGYLQRVAPQVRLNAQTLLTAGGCFTGVAVLGHLLARWLWRESGAVSTTKAGWKLRWTLTIVLCVVLMFVAGIGAVGFAHQSAWLARSEQPVFTRQRQEANRVRCSSNLRQIGQAILQYAQAHDGKLPQDMSVLIVTSDVTAQEFVCPAVDAGRATGTPEDQARIVHDGHIDYVYHGAGLVLPLRGNEPIVCEPLLNHSGSGMNILFADGRVQFMGPAEAREVMQRFAQTNDPAILRP